METILLNLLGVYVAISIAHLGLQLLFAQVHFFIWKIREPELASTAEAEQEGVRISVIYPIYNESAEVLRLVVDRARQCLRLPGLEVIFVDDGSPNRAELQPVYDALESDRMRVIYQENGGKRAAQYTGFQAATGELIVTVDSDTLISPENILRLVRPLRRDPRLGAVTGDVRVANEDENLLTRLIGLRYWLAFHLERAAQSLFGCVLCCSGPFSVYRAEIIHRVKDRYISQKFLGRTCTYGDDRHLTNLTLGEGYRAVFHPFATAWTFVPTTLAEYIRQQTRWNKSFYREILWSLKIFPKLSLYSLWDMMLQPFLFVVIFLVFGHHLFVIVRSGSAQVLFLYLVVLVLMASLRACYGILRTANLRFGWFLLYGFLHVAVLLPVRLKSVLTLSDGAWGTRAKQKTSTFADFAVWFVRFYTLVGLLALVILGVCASPEDWVGAGGPSLGVSLKGYLLAILEVWKPASYLFGSLALIFVAGHWGGNLSFAEGRTRRLAVTRLNPAK